MRRRVGGGRFARARPAFSAATAAAAGTHQGRLGDMKASAGIDPDAAGWEFVPAPKLSKGYAEAISN